VIDILLDILGNFFSPEPKRRAVRIFWWVLIALGAAALIYAVGQTF
jgi:hypothetical protein